MDVYGSGTNTQVILGSRNGSVVAVLTTSDGTNFVAHLVATDAAGGDFFPGMALGPANTFWSKKAGGNLKQCNSDLTANSASTVTSISAVAGAGGPIAIDSTRKLAAIVNTTSHQLSFYDISDPATPEQQGAGQSFPTAPPNANSNGTGSVDFGGDKLFALDSNNGIPNHLLAGISLETPDNLRLYDISKLTNPPANVDTDFFPTDNVNGNGIGSVDFGNEMVFGLDTNNGLLALSIQRTPGPISVSLRDNDAVLTWPGQGVLQSSTNVTGGYADLNGAISPYTNSIRSVSQVFFRLRN